MYKIEIKHEYDDNNQSQCRGCLSSDRKLTPVGKYNDLYCKLLVDTLCGIAISSEAIQLCWECFALLQKISKFQKQVRKVNEMFHIGRNYIYGTLSSLTTVTIHDTHPNIIYVNETNIKLDAIKPNINENDESNDSISNDDNNTFNNDVTDTKTDVKLESIGKSNEKAIECVEIVDTNVDKEQKLTKKKVKYKNKWAERKALLNKKPKFKIITNNEMAADKYFRRAQIDVAIVRNSMERERDGDKFRRSRFRCENCVVAFKSDRLLTKHNDVYHKNVIGDYICDICKRRMSDKKHLLQHIKRHFVRYYCKLCEFSCGSKSERTVHINRAHKKVFQCLNCELLFSCKQEFCKHYKEWHENFICHHCGVSFKMRYCIEDHIKKQHSPFECAPCKKRFSRYNGLWFHNKVCHSTPPSDGIPCPDCEKVFSKNIYMKDHRNLVHLKNFKYRCEECDKNFVRNADLVKHRRRIHEGVLPPRNKICYVCGRGFTTNEILTHHLRTHSGVRPYACGACPAAFAQRAALLAHRRTPHPKRNAHAS